MSIVTPIPTRICLRAAVMAFATEWRYAAAVKVRWQGSLTGRCWHDQQRCSRYANGSRYPRRYQKALLYVDFDSSVSRFISYSVFKNFPFLDDRRSRSEMWNVDEAERIVIELRLITRFDSAKKFHFSRNVSARGSVRA